MVWFCNLESLSLLQGTFGLRKPSKTVSSHPISWYFLKWKISLTACFWTLFQFVEYGKVGFNSDEPLCLDKSTFSEILGRAWIEYLAWLFCS